MVPAQNHLSKHHPHGGYAGGCGGGGHLMNGGPLISQYYYYYYSCLGSDLISPPMAEDESTTDSVNEEAPSNRDDGWLQLSIGGSGGGGGGGGGKYDQRISSGLVELDLLPGGGAAASQDSRSPADNPTNSRLASSFLCPPNHNFGVEAAKIASRTETETGMGMPLYFGTSGVSNFVQQEINWAFRPMAGVGIGVAGHVPASSPSTSSVASSSFLPGGGRRSSYLGRPFIQFQSSGVDAAAAAAAGPSFDVRIINPPRRPHSGIWFTLKALENQ